MEQLDLGQRYSEICASIHLNTYFPTGDSILKLLSPNHVIHRIYHGEAQTGTFHTTLGRFTPIMKYYAQSPSSWITSGNTMIVRFSSTHVDHKGCMASHEVVGIINLEEDGLASKITFYTQDDDIGKVDDCIAAYFAAGNDTANSVYYSTILRILSEINSTIISVLLGAAILSFLW